jgi:dTDP-4-dehydrorhamnose 3,5-epimerase
MRIVSTALPDVLMIEPDVFSDARGFFMETFNQRVFGAMTGLRTNFVQDNHSRSSRGVLRGLHYQLKQTQGKLLRVVSGAVFTVAVDIRRASPTAGQWVGMELSRDKNNQIWVPPGFAHGFFVLSDSADLLYKTTDYYAPEFECCIAWNDPVLDIDWPLNGVAPLLSEKDKQGQSFRRAAML